MARTRIGESWLVLVSPYDPASVPGQHLARHGEGFFLISFGVDSLADELERLGENWFDGPARDGLDDWRVRDLDVNRTFGTLVQLTETRRRQHYEKPTAVRKRKSAAAVKRNFKRISKDFGTRRRLY